MISILAVIVNLGHYISRPTENVTMRSLKVCEICIFAIGKIHLSILVGPCNNNYILVPKTHGHIPECIPNECGQNNVLYRNQCHPLRGENACDEFSKVMKRKILLLVSPTTSQLVCADEDYAFECDHATSCCIPRNKLQKGICRDGPDQTSTTTRTSRLRQQTQNSQF